MDWRFGFGFQPLVPPNHRAPTTLFEGTLNPCQGTCSCVGNGAHGALKHWCFHFESCFAQLRFLFKASRWLSLQKLGALSHVGEGPQLLQTEPTTGCQNASFYGLCMSTFAVGPEPFHEKGPSVCQGPSKRKKRKENGSRKAPRCVRNHAAGL